MKFAGIFLLMPNLIGILGVWSQIYGRVPVAGKSQSTQTARPATPSLRLGHRINSLIIAYIVGAHWNVMQLWSDGFSLRELDNSKINPYPFDIILCQKCPGWAFKFRSYIVFDAYPVGVGVGFGVGVGVSVSVSVGVTLSCLHDISLTGGWILIECAWM